ncbi:MAG: hypothetical protein Q8N37_03425 [bacterium]|nr:hypothetical protein [bacterium]
MENGKRFEEMSNEEWKEHLARVRGGHEAEPYEIRDLEKENKAVNIMGDKIEDSNGNDAELIERLNKEYNEKLDEEFKNEIEGVKEFVDKLNKFQYGGNLNGKEIFDFMSNLIRLDSKDHGKFLKFIKLPILNDTICREDEPLWKNKMLDSMVDYLRENKIKSETETIFKIINLLHSDSSDIQLYTYDSANDENLKWLGLERQERSHITKDWDERGKDLKRSKKYGPIAPIVKKISNLGKK